MKTQPQLSTPRAPTIPRIWPELSLPERRQLAKQLAILIRQMRQASLQKREARNE